MSWLASAIIVDVWKNRQASEADLAHSQSVAFRFAVQILSGLDSGCCIGSSIDDRLVKSFATPFVSAQLPETVGRSRARFALLTSNSWSMVIRPKVRLSSAC